MIDLPFGRGVDHPEGLAVWPRSDGTDILVVCDSPSGERLDAKQKLLKTDLFSLPL